MIKMQKEVPLGKEDFAKYPFLREASSFIEKFGLDLGNVSEEYPMVTKRAVQWVQDNVEGRFFVTDPLDPDTDILAYPLALAFVYGLKMDWVTNRFATAEQKRIDFLLKEEADAKRLATIAKKGFGWELEPLELAKEEKKFGFAMNVANYLEVGPQFHSAQWKLVNRYLVDGKVYLTLSEGARIVSGGAKNKILSRAKDEEMRRFELPKKFKPYLAQLTDTIERRRASFEFEPGEAPLAWVEEAKPPCIVAIMEDLEAGKNLSHMARFTLTSFMTNAGKGVDDVLALFSKVADFDEGKTRYQIEHIAGETGSKQKYKVPKCDVLRSFGLCVNPNEFCRKIWHPFAYYERRAKQLKPKNEGEGGSGGGGS